MKPSSSCCLRVSIGGNLPALAGTREGQNKPATDETFYIGSRDRVKRADTLSPAKYSQAEQIEPNDGRLGAGGQGGGVRRAQDQRIGDREQTQHRRILAGKGGRSQ